MTDLLAQLTQELSHSYDIERELPGGGMSRVFVAVERALGRRVVIKVLPPELAAGVSIERFRREIQLSAQLQHPHIVTVLSTGEMHDILYYTMPYIEGESLNITVEKNGPFEPREVLRVLHDVVDAIAYAHSRGVIHRDIKPANILRLGNHAVVTDFGVAKAISAALPASGVTSGGFAIGTPAYMAPEQLAADPQADHRVDIYAVGLLAYELLMGTSPFTGTSPQATMAAQLTRVPEPLHKVRPDVPSELSDLIQRCLEKLPENRPASALELLSELDAISTPEGKLNLRQTSLRAALAHPREHIRYLMTAAAAVLLLGAGAFFTTKFLVTKTQEIWALNATLGDTANRSGTPGSRDAEAFNAVSEPRVAAQPDSGQAVLVTEEMLQAFADSVREQLLEERRRDSVLLSDTLRAAIDRAVRDTLDKMRQALQRGAPDARARFPGSRMGAPRGSLAALRGPPYPGERRVLVLDFQTLGRRQDTTRIGARMADSLRAALMRRGAYTAVSPRDARQVAGSEDPRVMAEFISAGAVLAGTVGRRGDSLILRVSLAETSQQQPRPVANWSTVVGAPFVAVDSVLPRVVAALRTVTGWPGGGRDGRSSGGQSGRRSGGGGITSPPQSQTGATQSGGRSGGGPG